MPIVKKNALVPFPAARMFDLVAEVEEYPEFLPWCGGTQIHQRTEEGMVATIRIAYRGLSQSFTTENRHDRPNRIELTLRDGPFSRLHGVWTFKAITPQACRIDLELDYEMRSGLIAQLLGPVFEQIAQTMVDAFVDRAEALAGGL
ncbi:MAG: type II toxin-antitoxin system RatA family toxin [Lautropia sp.]|nr:type II toxin-antitoxin system RatA family toxin [Lautropia sp.]